MSTSGAQLAPCRQGGTAGGGDGCPLPGCATAMQGAASGWISAGGKGTNSRSWFVPRLWSSVSVQLLAEVTPAMALFAAGRKNASSFPIFSRPSQDNNSLFLIPELSHLLGKTMAILLPHGLSLSPSPSPLFLYNLKLQQCCSLGVFPFLCYTAVI